jgi:hypothetical protein
MLLFNGFGTGRKRSRTSRRFALLLLGGAALSLGIFALNSPKASRAISPTVGGCPVFPPDNIWNVPVNTLPIDPNSSTYVNGIGANTGLHPDFGSGTWQGGPIGIPYVVVPQSQAKVPISFDYADESDPGPYPIPPNAPIEGGPASTGDRHVIVVEQGTCKLYETWSSYPQNGGTSWHAGSGALFDLKSNNLRPAGWTSADAAGLPILPGLVRYDEVASGSIKHALRFTVQKVRNTYIWPGRHKAGSTTGNSYPPFGQRFRLKASFNISGYSHDTQVILTALKTYGMILADIGSNWYISGAPDPGWQDDTLLTELGGVKGSNFEAVDESSLRVNVDSGQAAVAPDAPSNLNAAPASTSQINLSWNDNSNNELGFVLERKTGLNGNYSVVTILSPNTQNYQDKNLNDNTNYYYRLRAYNNYGSSSYTAEVNATTPLAPPDAPSGLSAWAVSNTQVKLLWADHAHNEDGFYIERSPDGSTNWTALGAMTAPNVTTGTDSSVVANTTYFYRVHAHNNAGDSYSNVAKAITTFWLVTNPQDDGQASSNDMLSYALQHATAGQTISFAVSGNKINFKPATTSWTSNVPAGVNVIAACNAQGGPSLIVDGSNLPAGSLALFLNHNVVAGIKFQKFAGGALQPVLKATNLGGKGGNRLICSAVSR